MQTTQHVARGEGVIVLNEALVDAQARKDALVITLKEKSALVAEHSRLKHKNARAEMSVFS